MNIKILSKIKIVLIQTSHPGNIGSVARAMKTMCLNQLYLVSPELFPHVKADEMASGALDILQKAHVVNTLDEAIGDASLVIGTSARDRNIPWPMLNPHDCAKKLLEHLATSNPKTVAILFGRERSGLTNEELQRCHYHVQIPANPEYSSLNIAAAVQVIAYEILSATQQSVTEPMWDYDFATDKELEGFFQHLESVLTQLSFLNPKTPRKLMPRLRRLFLRTHLDKMEVNILRGILTAIEDQRP